MRGTGVLKKQLLQDVLKYAHHYEKNNWDRMRFEACPQLEFRYDVVGGSAALEFFLDHDGELEEVYRILTDDTSRELFYRLILFRILGHLHIRLPLSTPDYWQRIAEVEALITERNAGILAEFPLHRFRLNQPPMEVICHQYNIFNGFFIKQYTLQRPGIETTSVRSGDIVIDGGACLGETALAMSAAIGPDGRVFAFDFVKNSITLAQKNWALNPELASRITLVRKALHDKSNLLLRFTDAGPGTSIRNDGAGDEVTTLSIDDFKKNENLARIDFIKLDIEGSEYAALRGAEETIKTDKPRLAISIYHRLQDFYELPLLIRNLNPAYRFAIDHYSIHAEETVLYAW